MRSHETMPVNCDACDEPMTFTLGVQTHRAIPATLESPPEPAEIEVWVDSGPEQCPHCAAPVNRDAVLETAVTWVQERAFEVVR